VTGGLRLVVPGRWTPIESVPESSSARGSAERILGRLPPGPRANWITLGPRRVIRALLSVQLVPDADASFHERFRASATDGARGSDRGEHSVVARALPAGRALAVHGLEIEHGAEGVPDTVIERASVALRFDSAAVVAVFVLGARDLAAGQVFLSDLWAIAASARFEDLR
jgi:hypothetical protein